MRINLRRFIRISSNLLSKIAPKVYFSGDENPYEVDNLSYKGLFILKKIIPPESFMLDLLLEIPSIGKIPMIVQIIRTDSSGIAVEIVDIPDKYRKIWADYIKACTLLVQAQEKYESLIKSATHEQS